MKKSILSLAVLTCGLFSLTANAAVDWAITTTSGNNTTPAPAYGNTRTYSTSAVSVDVKAFAATSGSNTGTTNTSSADSSRNSRVLESAYLANYGTPNGLGVVNRDGSNTAAVAVNSATGADGNEYVNGGSEHAMDNNGRSEVMLLTFSEAVALKSLTVGWPAMSANPPDTDLFVLAWIGTGNPTAALTTKTFADIAVDSFDGGNGWSLVANLSNVVTSSSNVANFNGTTTPVSSSYWLVGTGGFANATATTAGGVNSGDSGKALGATGANYDYVKLAGIGGSIAQPPGNNVPEPGSLGLAGLALFGITALRRKKSTQ
nr:PEP-CTERM sorting domain-containing protein [Dechloromonas sp.]